jgi:hypothetical protein
MSTSGRVKIDPLPPREKEAEVFETPDDRIRRQDQDHELKLRGPIGRFLGSSNENLNAATIILGVVFGLLILSGIGLCFSDKLNPVVDRLFNVSLTLIGFIVGTQMSTKRK